MKVQVVRKILQQNEQAAAENRKRLDADGVVCINLLGGAGCGKTSLLEATLPRLKDTLRIAVLEGDLATTRDAERIAALDVPAVQLLTGGACHLNATLVQQGLQNVHLGKLDLLIIENVGNPICPANFDLGEHFRMVVLSVAEGHDKPAKYPLLFKGAAAVVLTKCDLMEYTDFDAATAEGEIRRVNPQAQVIRTSARTGQGVEQLADWIRRQVRSGGARPSNPGTARRV
jgi:hydrogenase nickel incorporation protein HypB